MMTNDICVYKDTSLAGKMKEWNLVNKNIKNTIEVTNMPTATNAPTGDSTVTD